MKSASRRDFIHRALAAGVAVLPGANPAPAAPAPKLKISVLSYSFRGLLKEGRMDLFGYLETCKYR